MKMGEVVFLHRQGPAPIHAPGNWQGQNHGVPDSRHENQYESLIGQLVSETADVLGAYHAQAQIENNSAHIEIARLLISTFMFHLQAHDDMPQACDALAPQARPEWRALSLQALENSNKSSGAPVDANRDVEV